MIGNYCKLITDICNKKVDKKINAQQLKKDIIDINVSDINLKYVLRIFNFNGLL